MSARPSGAPELELVVRRLIAATPERLFDAWTDPQQLVRWWGPMGVRCSDASVDLRVGGEYRIANALPDGSTVWIRGVFEEIDPPHRLVYSWLLDHSTRAERVTVRFEACGAQTEVIVLHERLADEHSRAMHEQGWVGCIDGLVEYLAAAS